MRWLFVHVLASLHFHSTFQLNVPAVLLNETKIGDAGVRARLSRKGINYVAAVLAQNLIPEIMNTRLEDASIDLQMDDERLILSEFAISSSGSFGPTETEIAPPNLVVLQVPNLNLTLSGLVSSLGQRVSISSESTTLDLSVELKRTSVGTPNLQIHDCKLAIEGTQIRFAEPLDEPRQSSSLESTIDAKFLGLLNDLVCDRIRFIVDDRVNDRLGLLPTKIPLSHINDDQLVRELAEKLRARRQRREAGLDEVEELDDMLHRSKRAPWDLGAGLRLPMGMQIGAGSWGRRKRETLIAGFNVSLTDNLFLDYTIVTDPKVTAWGLEIESSGEVSLNGRGGTPFGPVETRLPERVDEQFMLQDLISDFMVNSLMYHGHTLGLFNTRVDPSTPHFGAIMRTSCSLSSGIFFCMGDLFPTLRKQHPQRRLALFFSTVQSPVIRFRTQGAGGIQFSLLGRLAMIVIDPTTRSEQDVGQMKIEVTASMKMRLTSRTVRPKITLERIKLTTLSPEILLQNELDEAVMLAREVLQRMVNDILKDGIPIPVHPLFGLLKPKVKVMERALLLQTNFDLNEKLIRQLTASDLRR